MQEEWESIRIRLRHEEGREGNFEGYVVTVIAPEPIAPELGEVRIPQSHSYPVEDSGRVEVRIPEKRLHPETLLEVRNPVSELVASIAADELFRSHAGTTPSIAVPAPAPVLALENTPDEATRQRRLSGRIFDTTGGVGTSGKLVRVFIMESENDEPQLLAEARTDANGYFFTDHSPRKVFRAILTVAGEDGQHEVSLENGFLPRNIVAFSDVPGTDDDCACEIAPERQPDATDLVAASESFSTDLGGGHCIDPTVPNRVLEEFSFHRLVRTTDPEIKGTRIDAPIRLPARMAADIRKLGFGIQSLESNLAVNQGADTVVARALTLSDTLAADTAAGVPGAPVADVTTGAVGAAGVGTANVEHSAATSPVRDRLGLSVVEAEGISGAAEWRKGIGVEGIEKGFRFETARLRAEDIETALIDLDGFTPISLMTAERRSVHAHLQGLLLAIEGKPPGRDVLNEDNPVDWDSTPEFFQATTIAHGHMLHFKQSWKADGYSLGDLVKSIPLAPCQKKQIVVLDWERRDEATRSESLIETEELAASLSRDRDINEIANAAFHENIAGESRANTSAVGGGIGFAIGPLVIGGGGGASKSSSTAWQDSSRSMTAGTLQSLQDRTSQGASAIRNQRATVVQTMRQGERSTTSTEVIANHSHCHAMTVEHFEVLRHFAVEEGLASVQEVLFIPYLMTAFDDAKVLRWKDILIASRRDRRIRRGFAAIERLANDLSGPPDETFADHPIESMRGRLSFRVTMARPKDPEDEDPGKVFETEWNFVARILGINAADLYENHRRNSAQRDRIYQQEVAPELARAFLENIDIVLVDEDGAETPANFDVTVISDYRPGGLMHVELNDQGESPRISRRAIVGVSVRARDDLPEFSKVILERANIRYETERLRYRLFRSNRVLDDIALGDDAYLPTDTLSWIEERNPRREDETLRRRLLTHLNGHIEYYHRAIWLRMDAERRFMLLDGFVAPNSGGRSVASVVENRLIGVVGNSLVFPVAPGYQLDPALKEAIKAEIEANPDQEEPDPQALLDRLYRPVAPPRPRRLSVPTSGVFAEAVLGKCSSCEVIDDNRFWRFSESPCPDSPPPIDPVSTDSRRAAPPDVTPTPFPNPVVAVQNLPAAPAPTGMAAALDLLSRNAFKDITGLTANQRSAMAALTSSLGASRSFASEAFKLSQAQDMARDLDRNLSNIAKAKDSGLLSGTQASAAARDAILRSFGEDNTATENLTESAEVEGLLKEAANSEGSSVSIARDTEGAREEVEVENTLGEGSGTGVPEFENDVLTIDWDFVPESIETLPLPIGLEMWTRKPSISTVTGLKDEPIFFPTGRVSAVSTGGTAEELFKPVETLIDDKEIVAGTADRLRIKTKVRICYPADPANKNKLAKTGGPLPVVGIIHGNSASYFTGASTLLGEVADKAGNRFPFVKVPVTSQQNNHEGYDSLQEALAKHNIVSISVSTNVDNFLNTLVRSRATTLLNALIAFRKKAKKAGSRYKDRLDFENVGILGHSRGGDAVVDLVDANDKLPAAEQLGIKAVCSLAPTDFSGSAALSRITIPHAMDIPYLVIYGSYDGDVSGTKEPGKTDFNGSGFRHYDRAFAPKAMVYIKGATHNRFNSVWNTAGGGDDPLVPDDAFFGAAPLAADPRLSETDHQKLLAEYGGGFMRLVLNGENGLRSLFRGSTRNAAAVEVAQQWAFSDKQADTLEVNDVDTSKFGSTTLSANVQEFLFTPTNVVAVPSDTDLRGAHNTRVFQVKAAATNEKVTHSLSVGVLTTFNVLRFDMFTFRIGHFYDVTDQSTINAQANPSFKLVFRDDAGGELTVPDTALFGGSNWFAPDFCRLMHFARPAPAGPIVKVQTDNTRYSMQTMGLMIVSLVVPSPKLGMTGSVDPGRLAEIEFEFDKTNAPPEIWLDSLRMVTL